jgi:hypothetical protein
MRLLRLSLRSFLALPVAVGLLFWLLFLVPRSCVTMIGDGTVSVPLVILVVDDKTGHPIEGAAVKFLDRHRSGMTREATTSVDGRANFVLDVWFSEGYNGTLMLRVYRRVNYNEDVQVSAKGYRPSTIPLEDRTTDPRYHYDAAPPPILIRLEGQ